MSETEQERLDGIEAKIEARIIDGDWAFTDVPLWGGVLMPVDEWLRSRGRSDLVDQLEQNRQAALAGEVA